MQLHNLSVNLGRGKKRIGRGGKRGTYSGRGQKGQRSRAGHRIRPAERDTLMKIPKLRGSKNKPVRPAATVLNLTDLARFGETTITKTLLLEKGIIHSIRDRVKILSMGEAKRPLTVEGIPVSKQAREKIEKAGGSIIPHT